MGVDPRVEKKRKVQSMFYRTDELNNGKESVGPIDETFFEYKSFVVEYTVLDARNAEIIYFQYASETD